MSSNSGKLSPIFKSLSQAHNCGSNTVLQLTLTTDDLPFSVLREKDFQGVLVLKTSAKTSWDDTCKLEVEMGNQRS